MEHYYNIDNMKSVNHCNPEPASESDNIKTHTTTVGFRNFLQQFRKMMPDMSNSESFRMARLKFNNLSESSKIKYEYMTNKGTARPLKSRAVRKSLASPATITEENYVAPIPCDNIFAMDNGYGVNRNWNTAFMNFIQIYKYQHPEFSKVEATTRAINAYKRLMDDSINDNRYKAFQGMNFKCCPKKKQACPKKKKQCPKPKPACQQNQSKQKCPKSKPACPDPCCKKPKPCCPQPPPPFCPPSNSCPAQPCPLPPCGKPKCCGRPKCCPAAQACPKEKKCPKAKKCPKC